MDDFAVTSPDGKHMSREVLALYPAGKNWNAKRRNRKRNRFWRVKILYKGRKIVLK
jgi:hypothetical protein